MPFFFKKKPLDVLGSIRRSKKDGCQERPDVVTRLNSRVPPYVCTDGNREVSAW